MVARPLGISSPERFAVLLWLLRSQLSQALVFYRETLSTQGQFPQPREFFYYSFNKIIYTLEVLHRFQSSTSALNISFDIVIEFNSSNSNNNNNKHFYKRVWQSYIISELYIKSILFQYSSNNENFYTVLSRYADRHGLNLYHLIHFTYMCICTSVNIDRQVCTHETISTSKKMNISITLKNCLCLCIIPLSYPSRTFPCNYLFPVTINELVFFKLIDIIYNDTR